MKINRIVKMLRIDEWLFSKLPFLFLPVLICIDNTEQIEHQLLFCFVFFVYLFTFLGFGYAINDYSDREIDRKIGKTNIMGELSDGKCWCILVLLIMGCLPFLVMAYSIQTVLLLIFVYFWGAAYSVKPFRFKERGAVGLLVSALAQRTIPLLPLLGVAKYYWSIVTICGLCGLLVGLRYILIHQYEDVENDKLTGTNTYVKNNNRYVAKMIYGSFLGECILVGVLAASVIKTHIGIVLILVCIVQSLITYHTIQHIYKKSYFLSFVCVPFEDMYNFYLPLSVLIGLTLQNSVWGILIISLLIVSVKPMKNKWKHAFFGIMHWRDC